MKTVLTVDQVYMTSGDTTVYMARVVK